MLLGRWTGRGGKPDPFRPALLDYSTCHFTSIFNPVLVLKCGRMGALPYPEPQRGKLGALIANMPTPSIRSLVVEQIACTGFGSSVQTRAGVSEIHRRAPGALAVGRETSHHRHHTPLRPFLGQGEAKTN